MLVFCRTAQSNGAE